MTDTLPGLPTSAGDLFQGFDNAAVQHAAQLKNLNVQDVEAYLIPVLVSEGVTMSSANYEQLTQIATQLAQDPAFQAVYQSGEITSSSGFPSSSTIQAWIDNQFFNPALSTNENFLTQGLQLLQTSGRMLSPNQMASLASAGGTAGVQPFNLTTTQPGLQFGQWDSVIGQPTQWVEYETPAGTPILAPFGGTVTTVDTGTQGWGRRLFIHLSNGEVLSFGHLSQFAMTQGSVQPGQIIGYSGGQAGTPGAGDSTGPHIDVILQGPGGQYIDPTQMMTALKNHASVPGLSATGAPNNIVQVITGIANSLGIDPAIALATAYVESKWNPNAIGDGGHSVGLFQLNDQGEGAGLSAAQREDPVLNAQIALTEFARVRQRDPSIVNNPGLWAALAQRPADQQDYANAVNGLFGQIKSGQMPTGDAGALGGAGLLDALKQKYPSVFSAYNQFFGQDPTASQVQSLIAGGTDPAQVQAAVRALPSHLQGMNQGQYTDLRSLVDQTSTSAVGHLGTDGIVAELFRAGTTTPQQVQDWYNNHSPNAINHDTYRAIVQANQPSMSAIYNEQGFDPRVAQQQYNAYLQASGQQPPANPVAPDPVRQRLGGPMA